MAVEGPYNLEEIFQSVNFDFISALPEDDDFSETLGVPDDPLDGMAWYGTDLGATHPQKGKVLEEEEAKGKSFPSTPEREEEKKGTKKRGGGGGSLFSDADSSSSEGSEEFGVRGSTSPVKKRRSGTGKRGGWLRMDGAAAGGGGGGGRKCSHCGSEKTPQWRMGPRGPKTLCNACGVRYRSGRLVPEYRPAASPSFDSRFHSNSHRRIVRMRQT